MIRATSTVLAGLACVVLLLGGRAAADGVGNDEPQGPARLGFADDFPELVDHEWGFPLGGFGGIERGAPLRHVPVIFVHGNNVDAADWYPVRDDFRDAGWTDQELWAVSYNGLGGDNGSVGATRPNSEAEAEHADMGHDGRTRVTSNEVNVADLHDFITAVRAYTGSTRFSIVAHSLGVTVARRTLQLHPELRGDLVAFVGIAGANHGTSFCPPGSESVVNSCDEIAAGTAWLAELNGPDASSETYGPARWMTVSDGTGQADVGYVGPSYAASPQLAGADNRTYALGHNDLRLDADVVTDYRQFVEAAEDAAASPPPSDPPSQPPTGPRPSGATTSASTPRRPTAVETATLPDVSAVEEIAAPATSQSVAPSIPAVPVVAGGSGADEGRYRVALAGLVLLAVGLWRVNDRLWPRTT